MAELIKWLGYEKADVMGYSMGGNTAVRIAIDHPEVVDKLVASSCVYAFAGWHDYNQQGMGGMAANIEGTIEGMKQTPMYQAYVQLMPDAETNWRKSVTQMANFVGQPFDWSADIVKITAPTLHRLRRLGCRPHVAHRVVLRTARRRQAGRRLGRFGHERQPPRDPSRRHALLDVHGSAAGSHGPRLPGRVT